MEAAVKTLLELKAEFKSVTGSDWTPGSMAPPTNATIPGEDMGDKITAQGNLVRQLKGDKADKVVTPHMGLTDVLFYSCPPILLIV